MWIRGDERMGEYKEFNAKTQEKRGKATTVSCPI